MRRAQEGAVHGYVRFFLVWNPSLKMKLVEQELESEVINDALRKKW